MNYQMRKVMFSSMNGNWRTPQDLFNQLDQEFHFISDACPDPEHPLKSLLHKGFLGNTWLNPPYGKTISLWLSIANNFKGITVALLPVRTDTNWFWNYCIDKEIRLIKGRLHFSNSKSPAPFPSMIVIFK